jgi:hypothetical protein
MPKRSSRNNHREKPWRQIAKKASGFLWLAGAILSIVATEQS